MLEATKVIGLIGSTSSTNDKLYLLKKYASIPGLKEILRFIYNPYCKTGISTAKLAKFTGKEFSREIEWQDAIDYFSKHQTGADADIMFAREFINFTLNKYGAATAKLAEALVTQNLKMGVSVTSLNKVYGSNFIPKTGCMLGTLYSSVGHDKVQWPCIVTEKLDGVRRILVKEKGVCKFYSRSGHEDTGLVEILEEAKSLPDNYVYDGELLAKGTFKDSIAQRQATNSIANCSGAKTGLIFNIFDMVPVSDFYNGVCARPALERKILLAATFNDDSLHFIDEDWARRICAFGMYMKFDHIATVPILGKVNSLLEAEPIVEEIWARGGEGIMLNTVKGPYEIKRTKHLLKVKHTEEHILKVVGVIEGTGKYEEAMGAILVDYKGSKVGVGSGFTDAQRHAVWKHPEKYIGRYAEVETFGESTNAQGFVSLNCPIFKRFVGDVE
jgi:DNA ligase-1